MNENNPNIKKSQNPIGPKISLKCMKNETKPKRKGRMVLPVLEDKNFEENLRENDKK